MAEALTRGRATRASEAVVVAVGLLFVEPAHYDPFLPRGLAGVEDLRPSRGGQRRARRAGLEVRLPKGLGRQPQMSELSTSEAHPTRRATRVVGT